MQTIEDVLMVIRTAPEATEYANKALASLRAQGGLTAIVRKRAGLAYQAAIDSGEFNSDELRAMADIIFRDNRKTKNLVVRLSAEDYESLKQEADDLGVSLSDLARERLRLSPEPPYDY